MLGEPGPGSIPDSPRAPPRGAGGVQGRRSFLRSPGPFLATKLFSSPRETEASGHRPAPQGLTFQAASAPPGFSPAPFQEEIRPPSRHPDPTSLMETPPPCFSCQLLGGEVRSGEHGSGFRPGWGPEAGEGRAAAGWRGGRPGGGAGLEWVEYPQSPSSGGSDRRALPPFPAAEADPTPTSHTHLGPGRRWGGPLHWMER